MIVQSRPIEFNETYSHNTIELSKIFFSFFLILNVIIQIGLKLIFFSALNFIKLYEKRGTTTVSFSPLVASMAKSRLVLCYICLWFVREFCSLHKSIIFKAPK